ncbi:MAG: 5-deoxy-glucuronate isomerase [Rhodobacteraceae bacterium]|nr:5-deoxy-glucuronate isomerase [Paracoccaceae bacterium]MCY4249056.1 5-deoxy-glucuronate isomerase [Paracoccaceae bacterium]MCY4308032.1 5-deoxy-glucuronate isomerase [Paracoccaceae bacterium]
MSHLLRRPKIGQGKIHDISPSTANWKFVGFGVYNLKRGDRVHEKTTGNEAIIVVIEGKIELEVDGFPAFGVLGDRMDVFEKKPPYSLYIPPNHEWRGWAETDCVIGICLAPGKPGRKPKVIGPNDVIQLDRGKGSNLRKINNIAMEDQDEADSLLVTEVFTPQGNWSSYPPHRHDVDDYPNITYLEETYYHRLNPPQGFGFQRVFTDDGELDETICVKNHDVVLVPRGHHPCGTPFGYEMYYLNVMAGPIRKWRFANSPDHEWLYDFDPDR